MAAIQAAELQSKNGPFRMLCQAVRLYGLKRTAVATPACCNGCAAIQDKRRGGNRSRLTAAQRADPHQRLHTTTPRSVFGVDTATIDGQI